MSNLPSTKEKDFHSKIVVVNFFPSGKHLSILASRRTSSERSSSPDPRMTCGDICCLAEGGQRVMEASHDPDFDIPQRIKDKIRYSKHHTTRFEPCPRVLHQAR